VGTDANQIHYKVLEITKKKAVNFRERDRSYVRGGRGGPHEKTSDALLLAVEFKGEIEGKARGHKRNSIEKKGKEGSARRKGGGRTKVKQNSQGTENKKETCDRGNDKGSTP